MIEIRNDEISDPGGQLRWADRLADILIAARPRVVVRRHAVV
jgi:predicted N-formylglutamate amidohydrolase